MELLKSDFRSYSAAATLALMVCMSAAPALALDQAVCEERLAPIEARLASGEYPSHNVQAATQLRDSIRSNCGNLTQELLDITMEAFDALLPTATKEELEKEKAERQAAREAAKAERQRQVDRADNLPLSELFSEPPTARVVASGFVEREDDMGRLDIHDWDVFQGTLRVLSSSAPTREQSAREDKRHHVYVTVVDQSGRTDQKRVAVLEVDKVYKFGLFPDRDEIVIQAIKEAATSTLERWSISRKERLEELPAPLPEWAGRRLDTEDAFRLVTTDGNLFFANTVSVDRDQTAVRWQKVTLNGKILAKGQSLKPNEAHSLSNWFRAGNGGIGLIVLAIAKDEPGIASALETPVQYTQGEMTLRGVVGSERRTLVLDADVTGVWQSPALERSLVWLNLTELSDGKSVARLQSLTDIQQAAAVEYGELLSAPTHAVAGRRTEAVAPLKDGVAVLLKNNADRLEHPLEHGDWLYEFTTDGASRKTHLAAMAKHLKGRFLLLAQSSDESVSMLLEGDPLYIVRLGRDREPIAYGEITMPADAPPMLLLADDDGSWLLSIGRGGTDMQRLWQARVAYK